MQRNSVLSAPIRLILKQTAKYSSNYWPLWESSWANCDQTATLAKHRVSSTQSDQFWTILTVRRLTLLTQESTKIMPKTSCMPMSESKLSLLGPNLASPGLFEPTVAKFDELGPKLGKLRPSLAKLLTAWGQNWAIWVELGRSLADTWPIFARVCKFKRKLARLGQSLVRVRQTRSSSGRCGPTLAQIVARARLVLWVSLSGSALQSSLQRYGSPPRPGASHSDVLPTNEP